ncbi:MAG TPA: metal-dependent hydrolase [Sandaracinaceae bacterium LLY-WYZ-13_1]|nr:metal-dependent hydrolase [Sandaracinaceae bacterium LLY-WYZ-13_1]
MQTTPTAAARPIRVRKMDFPFADADVPRWWLYGNPVMTHLANGLNLLFPPGERFFIRSVKHYLDAIEDPELRARVKGFFGQEGRHGHEHERANRILERHGLDIRRFLDLYDRWAFGFIEPRVPPVLRLSTTVALEHFTATLARNALTKPFLDGAHPVMADLLRWHAAEEIEHKSVAFDVLREVDPRYSVRVAGLVLATTQLLGWWMVATAMLMAQEDLSEEERRAHRAEAERVRLEKEGRQRLELFRDAILDYLRPSFHPDDRDDYALAREYLERVGAPV